MIAVHLLGEDGDLIAAEERKVESFHCFVEELFEVGCRYLGVLTVPLEDGIKQRSVHWIFYTL